MPCRGQDGHGVHCGCIRGRRQRHQEDGGDEVSSPVAPSRQIAQSANAIRTIQLTDRAIQAPGSNADRQQTAASSSPPTNAPTSVPPTASAEGQHVSHTTAAKATSGGASAGGDRPSSASLRTSSAESRPTQRHVSDAGPSNTSSGKEGSPADRADSVDQQKANHLWPARKGTQGNFQSLPQRRDGARRWLMDPSTLSDGPVVRHDLISRGGHFAPRGSVKGAERTPRPPSVPQVKVCIQTSVEMGPQDRGKESFVGKLAHQHNQSIPLGHPLMATVLVNHFSYPNEEARTEWTVHRDLNRSPNRYLVIRTPTFDLANNPRWRVFNEATWKHITTNHQIDSLPETGLEIAMPCSKFSLQDFKKMALAAVHFRVPFRQLFLDHGGSDAKPSAHPIRRIRFAQRETAPDISHVMQVMENITSLDDGARTGLTLMQFLAAAYEPLWCGRRWSANLDGVVLIFHPPVPPDCDLGKHSTWWTDLMTSFVHGAMECVSVEELHHMPPSFEGLGNFLSRVWSGSLLTEYPRAREAGTGKNEARFRKVDLSGR